MKFKQFEVVLVRYLVPHFTGCVCHNTICFSKKRSALNILVILLTFYRALCVKLDARPEKRESFNFRLNCFCIRVSNNKVNK